MTPIAVSQCGWSSHCHRDRSVRAESFISQAVVPRGKRTSFAETEMAYTYLRRGRKAAAGRIARSGFGSPVSGAPPFASSHALWGTRTKAGGGGAAVAPNKYDDNSFYSQKAESLNARPRGTNDRDRRFWGGSRARAHPSDPSALIAIDTYK